MVDEGLTTVLHRVTTISILVKSRIEKFTFGVVVVLVLTRFRSEIKMEDGSAQGYLVIGSYIFI